ncbi:MULTISPECIES: dUTP diphosphatase [Helicobacter]|uniref:Deoxyuridine 5'-triphosphate nucleotidohydrolase n=1 Tax=Helicobacter ibis TaxID=2962633 RepID=A0ABT4VDZ2_9HELI|nr:MULTISPECIES: dUTP diphosphatase [Helicobacter]MDA3967528.1 dUTP diphosphatase [Helicobacter sp. WB40]MDA3968276.1 dUTP diphosphatase [Helicobacter ibis]
MATIKIKQLDKNATMPIYQSEGAAGFDLCSSVDITIKAGKWALIKTGLSFSFSKKYEVQIRPRSGLALKHGITILNTPGTIDSDYRGEIQVIAINLGDEDFEVKAGDRIAQAVLCKVKRAKLKETKFLSRTKRGSGGFGSTGI